MCSKLQNGFQGSEADIRKHYRCICKDVKVKMISANRELDKDRILSSQVEECSKKVDEGKKEWLEYTKNALSAKENQ